MAKCDFGKWYYNEIVCGICLPAMTVGCVVKASEGEGAAGGESYIGTSRDGKSSTMVSADAE